MPCRERHVNIDGLPTFVAEARERIRAHLRAAGVPSDRPLLVHFHGCVTREGHGPVQVAVPVIGSVEPVNDLRV